MRKLIWVPQGQSCLLLFFNPSPQAEKHFFPTSQAKRVCAAQSFSMHSPFARLLPFFKAFAFFQDSFLFHSLFCSLYSQCCFTESVLGNFQLDLLPLLAKFLQLNLATLQFLLVLCCLAPWAALCKASIDLLDQLEHLQDSLGCELFAFAPPMSDRRSASFAAALSFCLLSSSSSSSASPSSSDSLSLIAASSLAFFLGTGGEDIIQGICCQPFLRAQHGASLSGFHPLDGFQFGGSLHVHLMLGLLVTVDNCCLQAELPLLLVLWVFSDPDGPPVHLTICQQRLAFKVRGLSARCAMHIAAKVLSSWLPVIQTLSVWLGMAPIPLFPCCLRETHSQVTSKQQELDGTQNTHWNLGSASQAACNFGQGNQLFLVDASLLQITPVLQKHSQQLFFSLHFPSPYSGCSTALWLWDPSRHPLPC